MAEQSDLISAFPDGARSAPYVGRFGWVDVDFDGIPDEVLREVIESAWARTAPKKLAAAWRGAQDDHPARDAPRRGRRDQRHAGCAAHRGRLRAGQRPRAAPR